MHITDPGSISTARDERALSAGGAAVAFGFILVLALAPGARRAPPAQAAQGHESMRQTRDHGWGTARLRRRSRTNPLARAFAALLPLSIGMTELNGNEKFFTLPSALPTQEAVPRAIQAGDSMLDGSSTLVLFYESFSTTYSYTPLGRVDNPAGLKAALGTGNVNGRVRRAATAAMSAMTRTQATRDGQPTGIYGFRARAARPFDPLAGEGRGEGYLSRALWGVWLWFHAGLIPAEI